MRRADWRELGNRFIVAVYLTFNVASARLKSATKHADIAGVTP